MTARDGAPRGPSKAETGSVDSPGERRTELADISFPEEELARGPDRQTREEQVDLEWQRRIVEIELLQLEGEARRQDIEERKTYATRVYWMLSAWLFALLGILLLSGFAGFTTFDLSDSVLIALVSGTTVNVIGVFVVVMRYLFPRHSVDRQVREGRAPASRGS